MYGMGSEQHRLLEAKSDVLETTEDRKALVAKDWAPSWETMMRLDQEQQVVVPRQPLGLPSKLRQQRLLRLEQQQKVSPLRPRGIPPTLRRRQQLLRPRPRSPTSALSARQPWSSIYRIKNTLSHDVAPGKEAVGSGPESPLDPRQSSAEGYRMRSIFSSHSLDRQAVKGFVIKRRAKRRQAETSTPWPSKHCVKRILSYDISPEEPDVSPSAKDRVKSPRPTLRAARPQTRTHQEEPPVPNLVRTLETKAVRSEAEKRRARPVSRALRNQKQYAPSRSIWW